MQWKDGCTKVGSCPTHNYYHAFVGIILQSETCFKVLQQNYSTRRQFIIFNWNLKASCIANKLHSALKCSTGLLLAKYSTYWPRRVMLLVKCLFCSLKSRVQISSLWSNVPRLLRPPSRYHITSQRNSNYWFNVKLQESQIRLFYFSEACHTIILIMTSTSDMVMVVSILVFHCQNHEVFHEKLKARATVCLVVSGNILFNQQVTT